MADAFLKAALFAQVLKTSVAISIAKSCPNNTLADDFSKELQRCYYACEKQKELIFYRSNYIWSNNFVECDKKSNVCTNFYLETEHFLPERLMQIETQVNSVYIGLRGLLMTNDKITEKHIVPGLNFLLDILISIDSSDDKLNVTDLGNQVSKLHDLICGTFKTLGELIGKLELEELEMSNIKESITKILCAICNMKGVCSLSLVILPVKFLITSYLTYKETKSKLVIMPHMAISWSKCLLDYLSYLLHLPNTGADSYPDSLNESLARIYAFLIPLLNNFKQKMHISQDLIEAISRAHSIIQRVEVECANYTWLSNGSLGLLHSIKRKLQCLEDLPN